MWPSFPCYRCHDGDDDDNDDGDDYAKDKEDGDVAISIPYGILSQCIEYQDCKTSPSIIIPTTSTRISRW